MKQENACSCGSMLRQLRMERGWSRQDLVNQLGRLSGDACSLTTSMVRKWERDEHLPSPTYRKLFCLLYQRTATELGLLPVQEPAIPSQRSTAGTALRQLREERGWSLQETVAQLGRLSAQENGKTCHVTVSMMGKWERDEHLPSPTYRKLFCLLYQRTAMDLGFLPLDESHERVAQTHLVLFVNGKLACGEREE